ncbi:MAG: ABC transporter permease [Ilumatobacteraceae bacterium]
MSSVDTSAVDSSAVASSGNVSTKKRSRFDLRIVLPPVLTGGLILGIWYFVSYVILDPKRRFLLKPPHEVWNVGFANGDNFSEMMEGLLATSKTAFWGLLSAILLGFLLAVIMSQAKFVERAIFPYAVVLQAIPILAIVPLIGFWFGYGFMPRVFICVIIALFPIIVNTLFGLLSADQGLHDLLTLHNTGRITRLRKLMFPAALPAVFAGLRISAGLSVIGAIVGDFYFGQGEVGIGQLLKRYAARLEGEQLLAAVIVSSGLGVLVFTLFGWIANRVVGKWAADARGN